VSRAPLLLALAPVLVLAAGAGCGGSSSSGGPPVITSAGTPQPISPTQQRELRGSSLYISDGCVACHTLDGKRSIGPSFAGLADSFVRLRDGRRVLATEAFLRAQISAPARTPVAGYGPAAMQAASARLGLARRPADVQALVDFIEADGP
jgi:cytochrome c oxidase subunit 2